MNLNLNVNESKIINALALTERFVHEIAEEDGDFIKIDISSFVNEDKIFKYIEKYVTNEDILKKYNLERVIFDKIDVKKYEVCLYFTKQKNFIKSVLNACYEVTEESNVGWYSWLENPYFSYSSKSILIDEEIDYKNFVINEEEVEKLIENI